ncbi:MAG: ABC transporter substrate binding protein [Woeseiaceae bacterium]
MNPMTRMQGLLVKVLPLLVALIFSGCALVPKEPVVEPEVQATEPAPEAPDATAPAPDIQVVSEPEPFGPRVAVVLSDSKPAYENVATELSRLLEDYSIQDLSDRSRTPREVFAEIARDDVVLVIAIGLRAAIVAKAYAQVPVVFCQVFNIADNDLISDRVKGVAALPPLRLQVAAWKDLNPGLTHIGAIVGPNHDDLIDEALRVAEGAELRVHYRIARSDRETLYLFNRLTPDIGGFWLFPDNRVLSPSVLREILSYASRHRVQVAVFNPALLDIGATFSVTSVDSDIAETVVSVGRRIMDGDIDSVPNVTPLNEIQVQVNPAALRKFKLAAAGGASATRGEQSP